MAGSTARRTTIALEPELHRALRLKALESHTSLTALVNRAVRNELAADLDDHRALDERKAEPARSFREFLVELEADGLL